MISFITATLSGQRLMTPLLITTSTDADSRGRSSRCPTLELDVVEPHFPRARRGLFDHGRRHVDAGDHAARSNVAGRLQRIKASPAAEVGDDFAGPQLPELERAASTGERVDGGLWQSGKIVVCVTGHPGQARPGMKVEPYLRGRRHFGVLRFDPGAQLIAIDGGRFYDRSGSHFCLHSNAVIVMGAMIRPQLEDGRER